MEEVQNAVKPVLNAYMKVRNARFVASHFYLSFSWFNPHQSDINSHLHFYQQADIETLKKYCANEVIERCKAERQAFQSHGIFFDNKVEMVASPLKMLVFHAKFCCILNCQNYMKTFCISVPITKPFIP